MGFNVTEQGHVVQGLAPVDIGGAAKSSDYFNMKHYKHASILIFKGAGSAATVTLYEAADSAGCTEATMAFNYASEATAAGDTLGALTAATTAGFALGTGSGVFYTIELDSSDLTDGYPYLCVKISSATASLVCVGIVLSGGVGQDTTVTAIT